MKLSKLSQKIVIHSTSGEMMGYIQDVEIDLKTYTIQKIMVEDKGGLLSKLFPILFKGRSFCVLKDEIVSIGSDVILVEINCIKNKKTDMNF